MRVTILELGGPRAQLPPPLERTHGLKWCTLNDGYKTEPHRSRATKSDQIIFFSASVDHWNGRRFKLDVRRPVVFLYTLRDLSIAVRILLTFYPQVG